MTLPRQFWNVQCIIGNVQRLIYFFLILNFFSKLTMFKTMSRGSQNVWSTSPQTNSYGSVDVSKRLIEVTEFLLILLVVITMIVIMIFLVNFPGWSLARLLNLLKLLVLRNLTHQSVKGVRTLFMHSHNCDFVCVRATFRYRIYLS